MFCCHVEHFLNGVSFVNGARRVVWVNDYKRAGSAGNFLSQVVYVGLPPIFFGGLVGNWSAFEELGVADVGRVGGSWEEDFVAPFHYGCQRHLDPLRYAFGDEDVVWGDVYVVDALLLFGYGFSKFQETL